MNRRQRRLARRIRRQAERSVLTSEEWDAVRTVCASPEKLDMLQAKIKEARLNPWENPNQLAMMDWKDIWATLWDYIKAHWIEILRLILTLAPLLLEPNHSEDR